MKNILITGGAGFIGSHLCDVLLLNPENRVCVIDNLTLGRVSNIQHHLGNSNFNFYKLDIVEDVNMLDELFRLNEFDTVFHLAANSDIALSFKNPSIDLSNTFLTTFNILEKIRTYKVSEIVFASTSAVYGETFSKELIEDFGPLFPVSHYGAGKLASEAFISSFSENYNIKSWIIRFPNVIGERATHGVIFDFINKVKSNKKTLEVLGDGEQNKPYLYVSDLIDAIVFIWQNSNEKLNYFNVGVDSRTKVKEIAKMVLDEMKLERNIVYKGGEKGWVGDVTEFKYNLNKIHQLGWYSKLTSNEAVQKAISLILKYDF